MKVCWNLLNNIIKVRDLEDFKTKNAAKAIVSIALGIVSAFSLFSWGGKLLPSGPPLPSYWVIILLIIGSVLGVIIWKKNTSYKILFLVFILNVFSCFVSFLIDSKFI